MKPQALRRRLIVAGAAGAAFGALAWAQQPEQVVRIVARKFEYVPAEVTLARGVPVVLELVAEDVIMGFYAPDLKLDLEVAPGRPARLRLTPEKAGSFDLSCNVFCGDGHEDMAGRIHVA